MPGTGRRRRDAENRDEVHRLVAQGMAAHEMGGEQAALRRIATLVARNAEPRQVYSAVTSEVVQVLGADATMLARWDDDPASDRSAPHRSATYLGGTGWRTDALRWDAPCPVVTPTVRLDDLGGLHEGAGVLRDEGIVAGVACPIVVEARVWGALSVWSRTGPLPAGTEQRLSGFADLVATAVANAEDRARAVQLLREQAALRRVAVLVARGPSPTEVCSALAEELRGLLGIDDVGVCRFDPDHTALLLAATGDSVRRSPVGTRMDMDDHENRMETPRRYTIWQVWRTGRPARYDAGGEILPLSSTGQRWRDVRSVVACPIVVDGRLWGTVGAWSNQAPLPPDTIERLSSFTELAAMAIGNAQSRAELAASRARIVAAADETRRRIERNLHDGAQQRLVTLGLGLRMAQDSVPEDLPELRARIGVTADELTEVIEELREMARGIHPAILSESGLGPALRTLARRSTVPVDLDIGIDGRFPQPVEVAAYYVMSETITNTAKHARASQVRVAVTQRDGILELAVRDDGVGGAEPRAGSGLVGLRDRVEAIGGAIEVNSPPNAGTTVLVKLPLPKSGHFTHPGCTSHKAGPV